MAINFMDSEASLSKEHNLVSNIPQFERNRYVIIAHKASKSGSLEKSILSLRRVKGMVPELCTFGSTRIVDEHGDHWYVKAHNSGCWITTAEP